MYMNPSPEGGKNEGIDEGNITKGSERERQRE